MLLDAGSDIRRKNALGETFVHLTCLNGHLHLLNALAAYYGGPKSVPLLNERDNHKNTPAHKACEGNNLAVLQMLAAVMHADCKSENDDGLSPMLLSAKRGFCAGASYLIGRKGGVGDTDKEGRNMLHLLLERETITEEQREFVLTLILSYPELVYEHDKQKRTVLHVLAEYNHIGMLELVLCNLSGDREKMMNFVTSKTKEQRTALKIAAEKKFTDFERCLRDFPKDKLGSEYSNNRRGKDKKT